MAREKKTKSELQAIIMTELRKYAECRNVQSVVIVGTGENWDFGLQAEGLTSSRECRQCVKPFVDPLRLKYALE